MAHVNAPLSVHRFRNNVSAHSLHDEDGGKKFSFPRTMIKNHQDCKTAATSTTCHFAHQRRLEHEFSQPAGAFVPDPVFSACATQAACDRLSQTNAACVQPWQERTVLCYSATCCSHACPTSTRRECQLQLRVWSASFVSLPALSVTHRHVIWKSFRILPKIVVKYPHRHESSARIHDSLQANAMHYENTCAERFIYKFSGDDVKQNWTKCTQTTTSFVSLLQGHARGKPPDAQEESELQVHERKHKCQHLSLSFNKSQRLSLSLSTSMRPSTSTRRSPSAITWTAKQHKCVVEYLTCKGETVSTHVFSIQTTTSTLFAQPKPALTHMQLHMHLTP